MKNLSVSFLCLFIFANHQLQGMDKSQPISTLFAQFLEQNKTLSGNDIAKKALNLLESTNTPINQQDNKGNTIAHLLAPIAIEDRALLVRIFNIFIKKGLNAYLRNDEKKIAEDIAIDKHSQYRNYCYASNANLFHRLKMGFARNDQFVLHNDGMTISVKSSYSNL